MKNTGRCEQLPYHNEIADKCMEMMREKGFSLGDFLYITVIITRQTCNCDDVVCEKALDKIQEIMETMNEYKIKTF